MNFIHHSILDREKLSFAIQCVSGNNGILSQNEIAVKPYRQNWLFLRPNAGVNPSYKDFVQTKRLSSYDGVTPQNKPFGEYVGRCLFQPRVNPITLFGRFSQTQNEIGAFTMNAIITPFKSFHLSAAHSFLIGWLYYFLKVRGISFGAFFDGLPLCLA